MRLILFVLSVSVSAAVFAWRMEMMPGLGNAAMAQSDDSGLMAQAKRIIAGTPNGPSKLGML